MNRNDILRWAREAHIRAEWAERYSDVLLNFAKIAVAAEREKLAHWMRSMGYATGHGDTIEDLLDHLGTQIVEGLEAEVLMEREACLKVCQMIVANNEYAYADECVSAIRARSKS